MEYQYPFYESGVELPEGMSLDDYRHEYYKNNRNTGLVVEYTPEGGTDGTQPTFDGDPLIVGHYVRLGNAVHFNITVDFDNITSFGTGEYYLTLPFPARFECAFREGQLHDDSSGASYHMTGEVHADSDVLQLFSSDKVASGVQDAEFTSSSPITLTVDDSFHISGTYIAAVGA
jgi:hypothetical protein